MYYIVWCTLHCDVMLNSSYHGALVAHAVQCMTASDWLQGCPYCGTTPLNKSSSVMMVYSLVSLFCSGVQQGVPKPYRAACIVSMQVVQYIIDSFCSRQVYHGTGVSNAVDSSVLLLHWLLRFRVV